MTHTNETRRGQSGAGDDAGVCVSSSVKDTIVEPKSQVFPDNIPAELRALPRWVNWRTEPDENGKPTKVPYTPEGYKASHSDPERWRPFPQVFDAYENGGGFDGIGFVLTEDGPFFGGDLDDCIADDGSLETWAAEIVQELATYTEVSPSGRGLRIVGRGKLPPGGNRTGAPTPGGRIEFYDDRRYLTITGNLVPGMPTTIEDRQAEIEAVHARVFPEKPKPRQPRRPAPPVDLDDAELIRKAQEASNGAKFSRLWAGDWGRYESPSEADLALCNALVFWTAGDPARVDRLFRRSGLMREKWDKRHYSDGRTYGEATIDKALVGATEFYTPRKKNKKPESPDQEEATTGPIHLTDVGNGQRLVMRHGADLRYCDRLGGWLVWDGRRWELDETRQVERRAKNTVRAMYDEATQCADDDQRQRLTKHALKSEGRYRIAAMVAMAESERPIVARPEDFDRDPWLLNVANGTLDLRTGDLLPHQRERMMTRLAPVDYDPQAETSLWYAFLNRILDGNENLARFLQRAVGYSLTGSTAEQCLFILYGTGANGKTTLVETLRAMLGEYAMQTRVETLMVKRGQTIPEDIARLKGARLVTASEAEEGHRLAESLVKQLTGGDRLTARFLYSKSFEYTPEFALWLETNHKPTIYGTDRAIWRRIRLVPFTVAIPEDEQDKELGRKLRGELPGILAWAVQGCLDWQREGLGTPAEVKEATQGYRAEMDKLGRFFDDCCVLNAQAQAGASELYQAYAEWCDANGERAVSGTRFGRQMAERGFEKERGNQGNVYFGVGLVHKGGAERV